MKQTKLMPREKLKKYGVESLSEVELLALIIRTGRKGESVLTISQKVLTNVISTGIDNITFDNLNKIKGIGISKSCEIIASIELSKRILKGKQTRLFLNPKDVFNAMQDLAGSKKEHFVVFYLNIRNQEIVRDIVSIGTLNASLVHPREIFENAIKNNAASILIAHNHPSGDPEPSVEDIDVTNRIKEAGEILGIELTDHVIVTKTKWWSFNEKIDQKTFDL